MGYSCVGDLRVQREEELLWLSRPGKAKSPTCSKLGAAVLEESAIGLPIFWDVLSFPADI